MGAEERLCGFIGPAGLICTMPKGHGGKQHASEVPMTEDIAKIAAEYIDQLEARSEDLGKQLRRNRIAWWFLLFATAINAVGAVNTILRALS